MRTKQTFGWTVTKVMQKAFLDMDGVMETHHLRAEIGASQSMNPGGKANGVDVGGFSGYGGK